MKGNNRGKRTSGSNDRRGGARGGHGGGDRGGFGGGFRNNNFGGGFRSGQSQGPREMHKAICAECKKECEVPFKPSGDKPVYCRDCFQKHKPKRF